jgi:S1-C subfamily serine protease
MRQQLRIFCAIVGLAVLALIVTPVQAAAIPLAAASHATQTGGQCAEVNGQTGLNVRGGPGTAYGVVITLQPGTQVAADFSRPQTADGYTWIAIQLDSSVGWAISSRLTPCAGQTVPTAVPATNTAPVLTGINRDGTLDHNEISEIARTVVLIANLHGTKIYATGTGTITTPDGLIVTNAHVVEGADDLAIAVLDDINDPPEYRYLASVVSIDEDIDVALVKIRSDLDGRTVDAARLGLPYLPSTLKSTDIFRGDPVYIFGYPGIGDDYLVVTTGSIVSVENGNVDGQRLPVWYRTDAEIAPGNSGGLAVNGNGEFLGIPTFVQTEEETGGRLGGIRPTEVALLAVMSEYDPNATLAAPPPSGGAGEVTLPVSFEFAGVTLEHGAVVNSEPGITLHIAFTLLDWAEQNAILYARFYYDDLASARVTNPGAPGQYRDKQNGVMTSAPLLPCCDETIYDDLPLFIPYSAFGITRPGTYPLKVQIEVMAEDESWHYTLSWEFISYTLR